MVSGFWKTLKKPFFVLAPMADVTDAAFRRVIAIHGKPDVIYTEFVSADGLFSVADGNGFGYDRLIVDLHYSNVERPIVAQFFSKKPELMKKAAMLARKLGFDGVDINMGCPDKNVCKQGAGAAMIRSPALAREIIRATKAGAGDLPVSVKTRIGYDTNEIETWLPELLAENPAAVILHGRTKKELSKVPAHWDVIARAVAIRNELGSKTLIVGNGDVNNIEDGKAKVLESGCDGIMIGRGIFGNPWLFSQKTPTVGERLTVLVEHTKLFEEMLGDSKSFATMKKHYKSYISGFKEASKLRADLMDAHDAGEVEIVIKNYQNQR